MKFENIKIAYFIGIGGIGMSGLARYFNSKGVRVLGYDKTRTELTDKLAEEGIDIHFEDKIESIAKDIFTYNKEEVLVTYTPAVPNNHLELNYFLAEGFKVKKRSEVLGIITEDTFCIAVAGTHGKTTTSSIIAHILTASNYGCNAFLGGITANYLSNIILSENSSTTVVEADEYDRSFLALHPDIAVVTSQDADHLDIYGAKEKLEESFVLFAGKVASNGKIFRQANLTKYDISSQVKQYSYSVELAADFNAENIRIEDGNYVFDFKSSNNFIKNIKLGMPGRHNVENAVAAIGVALSLGISTTEIKKSLESYQGVKRRFETHIKGDKIIYIDDYAHHPTELSACIASVREMYPGKKITGIFQPHLFSRTADFANEFAESLDMLDESILLPIYPAREEPIAGVDSQLILDKMQSTSKKVLEKKDLLVELNSRELEVVLTLGAGDIDTLVEPIKTSLLN